MLDMQKTIHFHGRSLGTELDEMGEKVVLATMDGSISNEGTVNINKYTTSKEAYANNAETIEADWAEFEETVHKYAQNEIVTTTK